MDMLPARERGPVAVGVVVILLLASPFGIAEDLPNSPRVTPLVRVIRAIEPSVCGLFTIPKAGQIVSGSGAIIHPDGFVLTNNHVVPLRDGFALIGGRGPFRYDTVGRLPEQDLAIVKLREVSGLKPIPLGRSHDLFNGEPVVAAGNPGGRGIVFTAGVVSARSFLSGGPNALVMTQFDNSRRDTFIQFDAASNGGNSGGPLVNMEGRLIGVVSGGVINEQNSGLAIPIDRVWKSFERTIDPEIRNALRTGLHIDTASNERATVFRIDDESAAAKAGVMRGDVVVAINGKAVENGLDYLLALYAALHADKHLQIDIDRIHERRQFEFDAAPWGYVPAVTPNATEPGLHFALYHGKYEFVPDFETLKPEREGTVATVDLDEIRQDRNENYAVRLTGFLNLPNDSECRLIVTSDDGSRVYIDGEPAINHDGNHPATDAGRLLRLGKGLHPIRIEFFQGIGGQVLELSIEFESKDRQPVTADMLSH